MPRSFDEGQIRAILKRAAELEGTDSETPPSGLTEDELAHVAAASGIDPRHVATAIAELDPLPQGSTPWGGPLAGSLVWTVSGRVNDVQWEAMLADVRAAFGEVGAPSERGDVREWTRSARGSAQAHLTVTPVEKGTRLELGWNDTIQAVPPFVLAGTLSLILIPVVFEALGMVSIGGAALYLTLVAVLLGLARMVVARSARTQRRERADLMRRLEQITRDEESSGRADLRPEEPARVQPLLDIDDLPETETTPRQGDDRSHTRRSTSR